LSSYIGTYLQLEIAAEGLTRNIPAFSRFLEMAAVGHAEQVNFSKISNETHIPRTTIHEYYKILEDTLIASEVQAWQKTKKRKSVATSKFYFFDWGLVRKILQVGEIKEKTPLFGKAFESYLYQEIKNYGDQKGLPAPSYWRSTNQDEVDFIVNNEMAVEIKASAQVSLSDLKGLVRLKEEKKLKKYILVFNGSAPLVFDEYPDIKILPWKDFLESELDY
jgi:predicted AAA+ superfamily ATPase